MGALLGWLDGKEDGKKDRKEDGCPEGRPVGMLVGMVDGTIDATSVGANDGNKDSIWVGLLLTEGAKDGCGDGYGLPVGVVGAGEGRPVSVGELDGTKDMLGWLDGGFETLGAELGTPSNPLSLAPSPSRSNRLNPSPPILELSGSFALVSEDSPTGSKQKDPTFSTNRHSRPNVQSVLLVHEATHFSSKQ